MSGQADWGHVGPSICIHCLAMDFCSGSFTAPIAALQCHLSLDPNVLNPWIPDARVWRVYLQINSL